MAKIDEDEEPMAPHARGPDLRRTVFSPLAATIVVLLLALALAALWSAKQGEAERVDSEVDAAMRLFELRLAGDVETMQVAMEPMLVDALLLERFMAGDRSALLEHVAADFDELRTRYGISHMYFVGADRVTLLRVHQPGRRGDVIDRFTMREAQRSGRPTHGLELGPLGTLTLRVVKPLRHEGQIVGYLELGREVEHHLGDIRRTLGVDLHVLVRKDRLDREPWIEGQTMLGRDPDWERFADFVVVDNGALGEELSAVLADTVPLISRSPRAEQVELADGRHLALAARPLHDVGLSEVGQLVVTLDVSAGVRDFRRALLGFSVAFVVFAGTMVLLVHRIVRRTEQRLRHAELLETQAKARLEARVRERTAMLEEQVREREKTEAQLRQAQKMEVIGQLTGGVAHDFNNLLAIIMADLEYLRARYASENIGELVEGALEATERGSALVARLLAVSRRQPLSPRTVDANPLVEELSPLLDRALPRGVDLEVVYGSKLWPCSVDPAQLENLILNLVVNARDAMPEGGRVTITTNNRPITAPEALELGLAPGDYIELKVTDTGIGMSREVLERAFDPFFTTKEAGKGSGLGLSMAHGMAKQSGGHVEIESAHGEGTSVRLLLPRARELAEDAA